MISASRARRGRGTHEDRMSAKSDPLARFALAALIAFFVPASVRAQDVDCDQPNEREVRSLRFEGNQTFDTDQLSAIVITTPSSFARRYFRVFGTKRCYPSDGLTQDVTNLKAFYQLSLIHISEPTRLLSI